MKYFSIVLLLLLLVACQKEEEPVDPSDYDNLIQTDSYSIEGRRWVLTRARVYVRNMDTQEKYYFNHQASTYVSANIFGVSSTVMDSLKLHYTEWYFQNGWFTINGNQTYQYNEINESYSVYGLEGGTSRTVTPTFVSNALLVVEYHEAYGSYSNENFEWFNQLMFIPEGTECQDCVFPIADETYEYAGFWDVPNPNEVALVGTQWEVYRYTMGFSNVTTSDTLTFLTDYTYSISSGATVRNYTLTYGSGNNMKNLTLYGFTTLGGDYTGFVQGTFVEDGVINGATFRDIYQTGENARVWMRRLN